MRDTIAIAILCLILGAMGGKAMYNKPQPLPSRQQLTDIICRVQTVLTEQGYDVKVDGLYGSKTDDALFEHETKLDINDKFKRSMK